MKSTIKNTQDKKRSSKRSLTVGLIAISIVGSVVLLCFAVFSVIFYLITRNKPLGLGPKVHVQHQVVGSSGDNIKITDSNSILKDFEIVIPAGSYESDVSFSISYRDITSLGSVKDFNPLTPLIVIENGEVFANEPLILSIPISLPEGHFAMGFYYDEKTTKFEGIPLISLNSDKIEISTAHFSNIVISSVDEKDLERFKADSGFRPGKDDWQFDNYGSFIAPHGHCAGQSIGAMWYYTEKTQTGEPNLYGRFDNNENLVVGRKATSGLQYDDSLGYRFSSVIQHDINWSSWLPKVTRTLGDLDDRLTYLAFLYSMQLTKEPQLVGVLSDEGGHAMMVYRVEHDKLYLADPNYHGEQREITFNPATQKFEPYASGANAQEIADGKGVLYPRIRYIGKSAYISWDNIAERWSEVEAGTIGDDRFPNYDFKYWDESVEGSDKWVDVVDGMTISKNEKDQATFITPGAFVPLRVIIYRGSERIGQSDTPRGIKRLRDITVDLEQGVNDIGFYVLMGFSDAEGLYYVDFHRFTFYYGEKVEEDPVPGYEPVDKDLSSKPSFPNLAIGDRYEGGIVAHIYENDTVDTQVLVAAEEDLGVATWDDAIALVGQYNGGGFDDWRLPEVDELTYLYENKDLIGGFSDVYYWSGSGNSEFAYIRNFQNGERNQGLKAKVAYPRGIRPVRYSIVNH